MYSPCESHKAVQPYYVFWKRSYGPNNRGKSSPKLKGDQFAEWAPKMLREVSALMACRNFWSFIHEKFSGFLN